MGAKGRKELQLINKSGVSSSDQRNSHLVDRTLILASGVRP
jgi:hypothetical protein